MFDELEKYNRSGHFFFKQTDSLATVCNAPISYSGLYLIYSIREGKTELIYIGISGRMGTDGNIIHRKDGLRGRFLTGKQFGGLRKITRPQQMLVENIEMLDIHWYVTYDFQNKDFPRHIEKSLLQNYFAKNGHFPSWNNKL